MGRHEAPAPRARQRSLAVAGVVLVVVCSTYLVSTAALGGGGRAGTDPVADLGDQPSLLGATVPDPADSTAPPSGAPSATVTQPPTTPPRTSAAPATGTAPEPTGQPTPAPPSPTEPPATRGGPSPAPDSRPVVDVDTDRRQDGFVTFVTITNTTDAPLRWDLRFGYDEDVTVGAYWDVELTASEDGLSARGRDYNDVIGPGEQAQFGFRVSGDDGRGGPDECTLNGQTCRLR